MTAQLLTINSKTEFLLFRLGKQLANSLITTQFFLNFVFIFCEYLTDQISFLFKPCYYHTRYFHSVDLQHS